MIWRLAFQVIPVLAWALTVMAAVRPAKLGRMKALLVSLVLAVAFAKFGIFAVFGGNSFNPSLPRAVILACGFAYGAAMLFAAAVSAAALFDALAALAGRPVGLAAKRVRSAALAVAAVALSAYGMYEGACIPSVRRVEVAMKGLPAAFDGYRIVHMSDLHCSTATLRGRFERIAERVNALDADLIAITGDFVDGRTSSRAGDLAPLASLRARDGVVACSGNHEAYWDWSSWLPALQGMGMVFPEETGPVVVRRGSAALAIGGLPDPALGEFDRAMSRGGVSGCFSGAPEGAFRILLFHRPLTDAVGSSSPKAGVSLQLSGHTHGGAMPVLSLLVAHVNEGRTRGLYRFAPDGFIHVSPGTGQWAGFPLRLFNPAEITEVVLRRGK